MHVWPLIRMVVKMLGRTNTTTSLCISFGLSQPAYSSASQAHILVSQKESVYNGVSSIVKWSMETPKVLLDLMILIYSVGSILLKCVKVEWTWHSGY